MGVYQIRNVSQDAIVGFWEITENTEDLLSMYLEQISFRDEMEKKEFFSFKSESRKKEWLCARLLIRKMLDMPDAMVVYDKYRSPSVKNCPYKISISHTLDFVAVVAAKCEHIGIDIELRSDRIADLALKFLNVKEISALDHENKILHLYLHWCGKETMYKVFSKKALDFKENLIIEPFEIEDKGIFRGSILIDSKSIKLDLNYQFVENNVVVWCCQ